MIVFLSLLSIHRPSIYSTFFSIIIIIYFIETLNAESHSQDASLPIRSHLFRHSVSLEFRTAGMRLVCRPSAHALSGAERQQEEQGKIRAVVDAAATTGAGTTTATAAARPATTPASTQRSLRGLRTEVAGRCLRLVVPRWNFW